jgi:membrane protein
MAQTKMAENATTLVNKVTETCKKVPHLSVVLFNEIMRTRVLTIGAAVAFFSLLSLVPLLMTMAALLNELPIPDLFGQLLGLMALLVPPDAMLFVKTLLSSIMTAHPARILSIGILSYIWAAAGAFSSLIEALNIAYDVKQERSWWRDKVQALLLTFVCGGLTIFSLLLVLAGPPVIHFLSRVLPIPYVFALVWPPLRLALIFATFVTSIMLLYTLGPNRKISFRVSMPGAIVAVAIWSLGSLCLNYYIGHFANYSATYGSLGAIIILMLWLYLTSVTILVGAELNAELWKRSHPNRSAVLPQQPAAADVAPRGAQPQTPDAA